MRLDSAAVVECYKQSENIATATLDNLVQEWLLLMPTRSSRFCCFQRQTLKFIQNGNHYHIRSKPGDEMLAYQNIN